MKTLRVHTQKAYDIVIGPGLLARLGEFVAGRVSPCAAAVISDDIVAQKYGAAACRSLGAAGFSACLYAFAHGEGQKNLATISDMLAFLATHNLGRGDIVIALGGGVTGDMAGFAAACYMRGIRFIQVPTTLLAAIDSSVGGKTGVNLPQGKNLAGAFWQPELVLCDTDIIRRLPRDIFLCGVPEGIKAAAIADGALFERIRGGAMDDLEDILYRLIDIKNQVVSRDEREKGERQKLNFGHTIGHAIERASGYTLPHGHAVGIGMVMMARAAYALGLCREDVSAPLAGALRAWGLPDACPYPADCLIEAMGHDKKRKGDHVTLVVPRGIGDCALCDYPLAQLPALVKAGEGVPCR
nr:3-dehydroquinate synthase [bacterium]